jgi:outer membrane immunogenic protein
MASCVWPEACVSLKRLLLASVALVGLALPAMAADAVPPVPAIAPVAPPVATGFDWTGPYVGAFGGYGFGRSSATVTGLGTEGGFDENVLGAALGVGAQGLLGGITVGYNRDTGALLFGIEGTAGYNNGAGATTVTTGIGNADPDGTVNDDFGTVNYGWYATLAGRVGLAMDRTLLFASAGGVVTQYIAAYGDLDPGPAVDAGDLTGLTGPQFGYVLGAGAEFAFDANWTAKLEYNYLNLGTDTTGNLDGDTFTHRNSSHLIRFGLNYLFGN